MTIITKGMGAILKAAKKRKKKPKKFYTRSGASYTLKGAEDYVPYLKRSGEIKADRILKKKNIERIRQLPESIGGKGIKDFGRGKK